MRTTTDPSIREPMSPDTLKAAPEDHELDAAVTFVEQVFARDGESWRSGPDAQALILRRLESVPRYLLALGKARLVPLGDDDVSTLSRQVLKGVRSGFVEVESDLSLEDWVYLQCHHAHSRFIEGKLRSECVRLLMAGDARSEARGLSLGEQLTGTEESLRLLQAVTSLPLPDRLLLYRVFYLGFPVESVAAEAGVGAPQLEEQIREAVDAAVVRWPSEPSAWAASLAAGTDGRPAEPDPADPDRLRAALEKEARLREEVGAALARNHLERTKIQEALKSMLGLTADAIPGRRTDTERAVVAGFVALLAFLAALFLPLGSIEPGPGAATSRPYSTAPAEEDGSSRRANGALDTGRAPGAAPAAEAPSTNKELPAAAKVDGRS